jgi:3',5'-nucleoside bisphosphate phosphatase
MSDQQRNRVDLHTHTARSDGVLEPAELVSQMRAWGSWLVAITDHDTLAGVREVLAAREGAPDAPGERAEAPGGGDGLRILVGVEINTYPDDLTRDVAGEAVRSTELHILGLGVDPADAGFEALLARQRAARRARIDETLTRLDGFGLPVRDRLPVVPGGIDALGRPHVARALVSAGHADSVDDAFRRYLEPGRPAYVPRRGVGVRTAIEAVSAAGGIASLAHAPWAPREAPLIERLQGWGLRGLESWYPGWDEATSGALLDLAERRGLLATGGSDYHGDGGDYASSQAGLSVPQEAALRLLAALGAP